MDEDDINDLVRNCKNLKHKFIGVFAANNFPNELKENSFLIVNSATAENAGTHWLLFCQKDNQLLFADPLGQSILSYKGVYQRILSREGNVQVHQLLENHPIQSRNSRLCGLFCIYIAHVLFNSQKIVKIHDVDLIRFALHMMT